MADRPAKRQRRSTVILSDDDDDPASSKPSSQLELDHSNSTLLSLSPTRTKSKAAKTTRKSGVKGSPKSSPDKSRKKSRTQKEPEKTKSLHTFFNKVTDEQRWHKKSVTPEEEIEDGEHGDAIEDDELSDSAFIELAEQQDSLRAILDRGKPVLSKSKNGTFSNNGTPSSSQRFVKPPIRVNHYPSTTSDVSSAFPASHRPWADRYGPANLEELAVHKKKVADVRGWLENVLMGRDPQKLLVIKGPAGSGKTVTMSLLAQAMGIKLVFWQNPVASDAGAAGSVALQFDEFLSRGGQFGSLSLLEDLPTSNNPTSVSERRVLVVEEFPTTMGRSSNISTSFRSVVLRFLSRHVATTSAAPFRGLGNPTDIGPPMVMIISETLLSSSTAFSDSFTAHRLLGPEILNHPLVTVVEFNPVAPTFVSKALELVTKKEARDSKRRRMPGPTVLQRLADMGDVRSAVNSLEFLCVRGDSDADWSGTVAAKVKKTRKDSVPLTEMEKNSLQLVSQRETTLHLFHAAGKIVHNKREDPRVQDSRALPPPKPPDHLMYLYTPKASLVDIEALLSETGTDIQTFISTLHENYVLSCNGESFTDNLESCSDILSVADVLNPDSRQTRRSRSNNTAALSQAAIQSGSSDTLRQDEISFQTATRGLLFSLPYPVSRAASLSGRKADSFSMFYPVSLRLWKPTEEVESLIALFAYNYGLSENSSSSEHRNSTVKEGVAGWQTRVADYDGHYDHPTSKISQKNGAESTSTPARTLPATRDELTLEILPYLARLSTSKKPDRRDRERETKLLNRITQFHGTSIPNDEPDVDEDQQLHPDSLPTTSAPITLRRNLALRGASGTTSTNSSARGKGLASDNKLRDTMAAVDSVAANTMPEEKLYISDDDILDD